MAEIITMDSKLRDVYYNLESPACFAGAQAILNECKRRKIKVTKKQIDVFLSKQDAYTLHKPTYRRFKRNVTKTAGIDVDWQSDLADLQQLKKENDGYAYIAVFIDVLSRFVFARPLKRKTPQETGAALKDIIVKSGRKPWNLTTDRGLEYRGKAFEDVCKSYDITRKDATSPDVKCAIAERYIRTLKSRIWRHFTRNKTQRWIDSIDHLVAAINNSVNRTLGIPPSAVNRENQPQIRDHLYGKPNRKLVFRYKIGDWVRISMEKHVLSKGYKANFKKEIFVISKLLKNRYPATYKIQDLSGDEIDGIFYTKELVRVRRGKKPVKEIQKLLRTEQRKGELWHRVKWKGKAADSWVRNDELISI
jgi:hypothetical protein